MRGETFLSSAWWCVRTVYTRAGNINILVQTQFPTTMSFQKMKYKRWCFANSTILTYIFSSVKPEVNVEDNVKDKSNNEWKRNCICKGNKKRKSAKTKRKLLFKINFTLVASNILIVCLVSLVAYNLVQENQESAFHNVARAGITSILCDNLSMHPEDDEETFDQDKKRWKISVNRKGQYVCGTKNITVFVEKIVEKQSRIRLSSGLDGHQYLACGNQSLAPPSGEMTAYFTRISRQQNVTETEFQSKVNWENHTRHSYIDPSIAYENGELMVPEGRTYFVYASVIYNFSQAEEEQNKPYKLTLRICRKTYGYERTLLGTVEVYNSPVGSIVTSLNVAGHVLLQKGDILSVRVSNAQKLKHNSKGNTFGLFPL